MNSKTNNIYDKSGIFYQSQQKNNTSFFRQRKVKKKKKIKLNKHKIFKEKKNSKIFQNFCNFCQIKIFKHLHFIKIPTKWFPSNPQTVKLNFSSAHSNKHTIKKIKKVRFDEDAV